MSIFFALEVQDNNSPGRNPGLKKYRENVRRQIFFKTRTFFRTELKNVYYMETELHFTAEKSWFEDGMIYMILSDKREIRFSISLNEKLRTATKEQLENIEIICGGTGLHWPDLDEDLSVKGILEGRF